MTARAGYLPAHAVSSPSRVGQVVSLVARTLADRWRSLLGWGIGLVGMCVVQLAVYPSVHSAGQGMQAFVDQWPEAFREAFGLQAYSTGPGFLNAELFSLMVPFIMIAVGLSAAAAATAGEEEAGTADLLFALPVSRGRVLAAKAAAMVLDVATLAVAGWVVLAVGAPLVDLQVSVGGVTAVLVMTALLGLLYGSVGLLLGGPPADGPSLSGWASAWRSGPSCSTCSRRWQTGWSRGGRRPRSPGRWVPTRWWAVWTRPGPACWLG